MVATHAIPDDTEAEGPGVRLQEPVGLPRRGHRDRPFGADARVRGADRERCGGGRPRGRAGRYARLVVRIGTTGFAVAKLGIAATLIGILVRLWLRVESVKAALPELRAPAEGGAAAYRGIETPYGPATATERAPKPLLIHRMAERMWVPMVLMRPMLVGAGLVLVNRRTRRARPRSRISEPGSRGPSSSARGCCWAGSRSCSGRSSPRSARLGARCRSRWE